MRKRVYRDSDGELIARSKGDNIIVKFGRGYRSEGMRALRLRNNGSGYDVKLYGNSGGIPDIRLNLFYCEAEYLYLALKQHFEHGDHLSRVVEITGEQKKLTGQK